MDTAIILRMPCSFTGQLVGSSKGGRGWIDWTRTTGAMPSRRIKVHDRRGSSIATKRTATNRVLMTERSPITAGLRLKHGNFGSAHPPGMLVICHRFGHSVCLLADRLSCGVRDERGNRTSARRGWVCWRPEVTPTGPPASTHHRAVVDRRRERGGRGIGRWALGPERSGGTC